MARRGGTDGTRKLIQSAYIDCYVDAERNMDAVTVAGLCKRAGIARTTFYAYYDDAYSVMQDIQDTLITELDSIDHRVELISTGRRNHSYSTFGSVETIRFLDANRKAFVALLCDGGDPLFVHKIKAHINRHTEEMLKASKVKVDEQDIVAAFISGALLDVNCYWLKERPDLTPEEMSSVVMGMLDRLMPSR